MGGGVVFAVGARHRGRSQRPGRRRIVVLPALQRRAGTHSRRRHHTESHAPDMRRRRLDRGAHLEHRHHHGRPDQRINHLRHPQNPCTHPGRQPGTRNRRRRQPRTLARHRQPPTDQRPSRHPIDLGPHHRPTHHHHLEHGQRRHRHLQRARHTPPRRRPRLGRQRPRTLRLHLHPTPTPRALPGHRHRHLEHHLDHLPRHHRHRQPDHPHHRLRLHRRRNPNHRRQRLNPPPGRFPTHTNRLHNHHRFHSRFPWNQNRSASSSAVLNPHKSAAEPPLVPEPISVDWETFGGALWLQVIGRVRHAVRRRH